MDKKIGSAPFATVHSPARLAIVYKRKERARMRCSKQKECVRRTELESSRIENVKHVAGMGAQWTFMFA
jgi:hypothetical protein